jgi:hypothetical protein
MSTLASTAKFILADATQSAKPALAVRAQTALTALSMHTETLRGTVYVPQTILRTAAHSMQASAIVSATGVQDRQQMTAWLVRRTQLSLMGSASARMTGKVIRAIFMLALVITAAQAVRDQQTPNASPDPSTPIKTQSVTASVLKHITEHTVPSLTSARRTVLHVAVRIHARSAWMART